MLWHLQIDPAPGQIDLAGRRVAADAAELGLPGPWSVGVEPRVPDRRAARPDRSRRGPPDRPGRPGRRVVRDPRRPTSSPTPTAKGRSSTSCPSPASPTPRPRAPWPCSATSGFAVENVRTIRTYRRRRAGRGSLARLIGRVLANDAVEQAVVGTLAVRPARPGDLVPLRAASRCRSWASPTPSCSTISQKGQLHFSLAEFRAVEAYFAELGREPTDCELETLAQTWSEHCSHKTLRGRIEFNGQVIDNLLKQTIFGATQADGPRLARQRLRRQRGRRPVRRRVRRLLQGRDPQPPLGDRPLRRGQHRARRRDPRPPRHRPRRQADLQHRRLLRRPARHPGRLPARRRPASSTDPERGRRRGPRLRQPDGHPDRQRGPGRPSRATWPTRWSSAGPSA